MTKTIAKKFSLNVAPTFKAPVQIHIPGAGEAEINFTFKSRTKDELKEFTESLSGIDGEDGPKDADVLLDIASGWDLDEPFDAASLEKLVQRYMGAAQAVISAYFNELTGARTKN
ncbi:phage tail assembly chaperone [Massilia sp. P8910]|uniref:phage tail assembly chaperone n=1 Tax=Massilia antarctica TaxID=2765360 RepID=UPI001E333521|nr:phage tail assembly chaperone [Massilia antarctica]MCE3605820.1 phage tail assembly chaperone [Massilia antarctica]